MKRELKALSAKVVVNLFDLLPNLREMVERGPPSSTTSPL
jgi:hypothetical protein